jgi:hypothetical protein
MGGDLDLESGVVVETVPTSMELESENETMTVENEHEKSTIPVAPDSETPSVAVPVERPADITLNNLGPVSDLLMELMKRESKMICNILKIRLAGKKNTETLNEKRLRKAAGLFISFGHYIPQIQNNDQSFTDEELFEILGRAERCKQLLDDSYAPKRK